MYIIKQEESWSSPDYKIKSKQSILFKGIVSYSKYFTSHSDQLGLHRHAVALTDMVKMQENLFQRCTHILYCSVLSLGGNVNTRWTLKSDMGSIFHIKKSMKYSSHRKLLCELSKLSKCNPFNLLGY